ncbi:putative secreted protein (Por secretion system target) [Chitinophaga niastensis]|uniref:Putative secreted protein (Por secretion system target) n=1 Tax=Chitinophaga niastensis TaxID=536980 RepID=A0A2P8HA85_CHINA|nr:M43 family zinc metalloprotease [Chitinophaga niastensis]PSL43111.1 putative secreted protein (Por secretion system target) [Chitinophaga niastensis]
MKIYLHKCRTLVALLLCLTVHVSTAQKKIPPLPDHCASSRVMKDLYHQIPSTQNAANKQEAFTRQFISNKQNQRLAATAVPVEYVIPIVFHVNDAVNPEKVTMAQIESAMDILNEDYSATNWDFSAIDPRFKSLAANLHITFKLADIDPDGNPTTGVTYHYNDLDGRSPDGYGSAVKHISYWPGEKYLNVWVVNEVEKKGVFNNSGWAFLPDDWVYNNKLDGIMYNCRYLGAEGVGCSEVGYPGMKRVLTHEIGHFLNLLHTFENGCNAPGDYVDDTPPTTVNSGCDVNAHPCGPVANIENYMDYASCTKMFTLGQSDRMIAALNSNTGRRSNLWSATNLAATIITAPAKRFLFSTVQFVESDKNDGSVGVDMGNGTWGKATVTALDGAKFVNSTGLLVSGVDFTTQNLPAGLAVKIDLQTDSTALLSFTGKALQHGVANNTDSLKITFLNPAIAGGTAGLFNPTTTLSIHFIDPYKIVYKDVDDVVIDQNNNFVYFSMGVGDANYGGWWYQGKLRFETYQKAAVCEDRTVNITPLEANTLIGLNSNFVNGGPFPFEHDIYSPTYNQWDGKTAFIGVRFTIKGKYHYGWMRMTVFPGGNKYIIRDYAYNEAPEADIRAGEVSSVEVSWSGGNYKETLANDGSIGDTTDLFMYSTRFAIGTGNFIKNTHYTVSNLPAGLEVQLVATDRKNARLYFSGKAYDHTTANNTNNVVVTLLPAAFEGISKTFGTASKTLSITYRNPYIIKYVDVPDTTVSPSNPWSFFWLEDAPDIGYGIWIQNGQARFETYNREMVCVNGTKNITLIPANTVIDSSANFVAGGNYPDEHNINAANYTTWNGQNGYAGFRYVNAGETNYGWFHFSVAADGHSYTLLDYAYNTKPGAPITTGQHTIDSSIIPVAAFTADSSTTIKKGKTVGFTDQSTGYVLHRNWTFTGGSPASDTSMHPVVTYLNKGVYLVTLVVTGKSGNDTLTKATYITVTDDSLAHVGDYCTASTALNYNSITNVKFAGIDQPSLWNGYSDFTTDKAVVVPGRSYDLEISTQIDYWNDIAVAAWIDWNGDKVLDEATEKVYVKRGTGPYKQTITVPANAVTGPTLMRIRLGYGYDLISCGQDAYMGEVEDYSINITTDTLAMATARMATTSVIAIVPHLQSVDGLKATNPFTDNISIWYTAKSEGKALIRLFDLQGNIIVQKIKYANKGQQVFRLEGLSGLPAGFYIIDINSSGEHARTKVVK